MKKNLAVSVKMLVDTFRVCSMESMLNPNVQSYMNAFFLIFTKRGGEYDCTPGSPFSRNDSPGLEWLEIRYGQMKQKTIPVI